MNRLTTYLSLFIVLIGSLYTNRHVYAEPLPQTDDDHYPPNIDYGQQGDFLAKRATDAGRSAIIQTAGPLLLLLPETPGSSGAHVDLKLYDSAWDISDLTNPQFKRYINCHNGVCRNGMGIHAHAVHTNFWDGNAYVWTNNYWQLGNSHTYDPATNDVVSASPPWNLTAGRLYTPFYINDFWSYGAPFDSSITLHYTLKAGPDWRGHHLATWDHLGETGVTGFFSFHGDLMVVASDQADTGMAVYSMRGWKAGIDGSFKPQLLSVYQPELYEPDGTRVGIGGYWVEPYGTHKMVWAARGGEGRNHPAMYVVDFADPYNPQLTCELYFNQDKNSSADGDVMTHPMYVNFQDQYAYVDDMKVDIPACEATYLAGKGANPNYTIDAQTMSGIAYKFATHHNHCDASQYFRPLGQVGVFGGYDRFGTEAIVTYTGPTFDEGSWTSAGLIAHNFSPNRALVSSGSVRVGDNIQGRIVTQVEKDERVNTQGLCFFVTSDEPDTNPPYIAGHRPTANQTNVSADTFISLHIPETLRGETLVDAFQLIREDTGAAIPFTHRLTHSGTVTLWPVDDLPANVTFTLSVSGVQDFMGNRMLPYSYRFSTGSRLGSVPTNTPPPTATQTASPMATSTPLPTATSTATPLPSATAAATQTLIPTASRTPLPAATTTSSWTSTLTATTHPSATPFPTATMPPSATPTDLPPLTATQTTVPQPTATASIAPPQSTPAELPPSSPTASAQPTQPSAPSPTPTLNLPEVSRWERCAAENEICSVPRETVVRYGGEAGYAYLNVAAGEIDCSNQRFGDPLPGQEKRCDYWIGEPAAVYDGIPYYPNQSSEISCLDEAEPNNVWVVNPDNNSLSVLDTFLEPGSNYIRVRQHQEIYLNYERPTSVTRVGTSYAVTYSGDDKVVFHDALSFYPIFSIDTGHGSRPTASVAAPDGQTLYVSLYGSGEVIEIELSARRIRSRVEVGPTPKGMALHGNQLLVTRFISPSTHAEVYHLDVAHGLSLLDPILVNKVLVSDDLHHGSGLPNYLSSIVINREGTEAFVTAVKANLDRGVGPHHSGVPLDDDNTVRPMLIRLDLVNNQDANRNPFSPEGTIDFDNGADPAGVTLLVDGETRVVTLQGNNFALLQNERFNTRTQLATGFGPQEMCSTLRGLYVKNFTGRSVTAIDIASYLDSGDRNPDQTEVSTVGHESLSDDELAGLRIFYHSSTPEMGLEGYISCASCHKGGGHDGQTWDMTQMGEGLRNTISLNGASGTRFGNLHWSANFDEVQDFELQIETLNRGTGLVPDFTFNGASPLEVEMAGRSADLDALAAYVSGLGKETVQRSPYRNYAGELTEAAQRGETLFSQIGCASCHAGEAFRDGQMHDVGTMTEASGSRLFGPLLGIRTPTLIELWDSAPYFHDGSAATLTDVLDRGTHAVALSPEDEAALIEFLLSIDREMYVD